MPLLMPETWQSGEEMFLPFLWVSNEIIKQLNNLEFLCGPNKSIPFTSSGRMWSLLSPHKLQAALCFLKPTYGRVSSAKQDTSTFYASNSPESSEPSSSGPAGTRVSSISTSTTSTSSTGSLRVKIHVDLNIFCLKLPMMSWETPQNSLPHLRVEAKITS